MRLHVDLASLKIVQVEKTPEVGQPVPINGKFLIPLLPGTSFPVNSSSYVLDEDGELDGKDVVSRAFAHLLSLNPGFKHVHFNPLIRADDVGEIDAEATFKDATIDPPVLFPSRFQSGRANTSDAGQMPTHTALLPENRSVDPARPGVLITKDIDLTPYIPEGKTGLQTFSVYWRLLAFTTTDDIAASHGKYAGVNEPAIRYVYETEQEPDGFSVYLSVDGGDHWCEVELLTPISFTSPAKKVRVAFVNRGTSKVYLAHYAVLM